MATSEQSFGDRLQRGRSLQGAIAGFSPAFAPADADLLPAAFDTFLDGLDTLNTAVATIQATWSDLVTDRQDTVKDIKARALRASSRVKSNTDWASKLPAVKAAADRLRGYRAPRPKVPTDAPPPPPARDSGDGSFGDLKVLLDKLIAALGNVPGYDTGAPADLTVSALTALSTALNTANKDTVTAEQDLREARSTRFDAYNSEEQDDPGLRAKMSAIKEAVKSQYGSTSPEYAQVKGIKV